MHKILANLMASSEKPRSVFYIPDFTDSPPPEKFNYHLRFQLKRATMGATLIKVDIKTGALRRIIDVSLAQFDTNVT